MEMKSWELKTAKVRYWKLETWRIGNYSKREMGGKNWELGIKNSNAVSWKIAKVGNYKNSELKMLKIMNRKL